MAEPVTRKTFKIELEVTVEMEEVAAQPGRANEIEQHLLEIKHLQQALLENENALLHQMMITALEKLQEYIDYLASQDNLYALRKVVESLEAEDRDFFEQHAEDLFDLTRPIRFSSLSAQIDNSTIYEKHDTITDEADWQPCWSDLQQNSELGKLLALFATPAISINGLPVTDQDHNFLLRYLTQEVDGVHMEAYCTCGESFVEVGEDQTQVLDALWHVYQGHFESKNIAGQLLRNWAKARNNPIRKFYRS